MLSCDLYDQKGAKKGTLELPESLFGQEVKVPLMHQALVRQQANKRHAIADTKTRSEIACSKRKIYRQKGTGNARHGQKSANIFRGGGIVFGPLSNRNFEKLMPRSQRRNAIFSALSAKANDKKVLGLSEMELEKPQTKEIVALIAKLPVERSALIVTPEKNANLQLSTRNLKNVKAISAGYVSVEDLFKYDNLILLETAVPKMLEVFKPKAKAKTTKTA